VVLGMGQHFLEEVRERPVAQVVKKRRGKSLGPRLVVEALVRG